MKKIAVFIACVVASFFLSPQETAYAAPEKSTEKTPEKIIVYYINQYRASHRLPPLKPHPLIAKEAKQHSIDMATHRIPFGHDYFNERIQRLFHQITPNTKSGAENVAYNYKDLKELVKQWTQSPGHRRNIVGNYQLTGIGIASDAQGKKYYTQIFLK